MQRPIQSRVVAHVRVTAKLFGFVLLVVHIKVLFAKKAKYSNSLMKSSNEMLEEEIGSFPNDLKVANRNASLCCVRKDMGCPVAGRALTKLYSSVTPSNCVDK